MSTKDGAEAEADTEVRADKAQDAELDEGGRLIVGGLVTAIGLGVLVMALAALHSNWFPTSPPKQDLLWLFLAGAGAAGAFFVGLNPAVDRGFVAEIRRRTSVALARDERSLQAALKTADADAEAQSTARDVSASRRADLEAELRRPILFRGAALLAVGGVLVAVCFSLIAGLAGDARGGEPTWSQFSLALPSEPVAEATTAAQAVTMTLTPEGLPTAVDQTKALEKTAKGPPVVLTWWAEDPPAEPGFGGGALPIALGGLFIVALGVWLPHVGFSGLNTASGAVSKLIAPVLSIGLVALGAGQQAEKERVEADVRLAEQGLPATMSLTSVQRERRDREVANLYVLERDRLSPEALRRVEASLKLLDDDLRAHRSTVAASASSLLDADRALLRQIDGIRLTLRTRLNQPLKVADLDSIRTSLSLIEEDARMRADTNNVRQCDLMAKEAAAFKERADVLEAEGKDKAEARRSLITRAGDWVSGAPRPSDGTYESRAAADLRQRQGEIVRRHAAFCPPTQRMADAS